MGTDAIFGSGIFGSAIFGTGGTTSYCLADVYSSLTSYETGIESVVDSKFMGVLNYRYPGAGRETIVSIKKG